MNPNTSRIMIAGTHSGCGKTTVTCAILKAFINRHIRVASFKVGPDYIDPMFHSEIIGAKSRNLDMFLCGEQETLYLLKKNSQEVELSVIEGVMGFYDGMGMDGYNYSSCEVSNKTDTPVLLVVNCRGVAYSVIAMIKGYLELHPNRIVGVILNHTSSGMYERYKKSIESILPVKVLGFMPFVREASLESRHLGLVTAEEIDQLEDKINCLAQAAEESIDLDEILRLSKDVSPLPCIDFDVKPLQQVKIGIAKDRAFCFYYEDSLELLRQLGATLVPFSPMKDGALPLDIDGLILGGGYPELHLEELQNNNSLREAIKRQKEQGMPIYAECGGFMYLGRSIQEKERSYSMVGALDSNSTLSTKLQNFGYITLTALQDNLFSQKGQRIHGHEFHYSTSDLSGDSFQADKLSGKSWQVGFTTENLYAGYPHIHLWGNVEFARSFIEKCWNFKNKRLKVHQMEG